MLGKLMGVALGRAETKRGNATERGFMEQQYQNQRSLNQQGHDLQMDMWNKTNYGAQLQHMKDAGLNPALMYGMGGGGGATTGSQGGGSAAKGNAQKQMGIEGLMAASQAALNDSLGKKAQQEGNLAETRANELRGDTKEQDTRIANIATDTGKKFEELQNQVIQNKVDLATATSRIEGIIAEEGTKVIERDIKDETEKKEILKVTKEVGKLASEITKNNAQEQLAKMESRIKAEEAEMAEKYGTYKGDDIRFRSVKAFFTETLNGVKTLVKKYKDAKGMK
jgi:hypothetical protein